MNLDPKDSKYFEGEDDVCWRKIINLPRKKRKMEKNLVVPDDYLQEAGPSG